MPETLTPAPMSATAPARPATPPADTATLIYLSREQLTHRPLRTVDVVLKDGCRIKLRALKQTEREALDEAALLKDYKEDGTVTVKVENRGFQAKALAMSMITPDGAPYWPSAEEGARALGELDDALFDELFEPCDKLNILTAKMRADLGKDSGVIPSSSSSSTLPTSGAVSSKS